MFVREKETKTGLLIDKALLSMAGSIGGLFLLAKGYLNRNFDFLSIVCHEISITFMHLVFRTLFADSQSHRLNPTQI